MAYPSVSYTFANSTTADATQVNQNFTDMVNGFSDGTKDINVSAITAAGNVAFNGNTAIGNASGDDLTITASLASSIAIKTTNTYDIGSTTKGIKKLYFGTSAGSNSANLVAPSITSDITLTLPSATGNIALSTVTVQRLTSGTGYTTPSNVKYIRVRMVGGGGGGGGDLGNGGTGGSTTFSDWTCAGGVGSLGGNSGEIGGVGGAPTTGTGTTVVSITGGRGAPGDFNGITNGGGSGASSPFGGQGGGGKSGGAGQAAVANSGSGGGGNGYSAGVACSNGGGGSGAYQEFIISSPSATYTYGIGAAGAAGTATNFGGGAGGAGIIIVEEYY